MTPFEADGLWLRCALHAHTTDSDGEPSPDQLARHTGRSRGARANAGRLGYPSHSQVLKRTSDGLLTEVRLERQWGQRCGRVEVADTAGGRAWTNPLWIA